MLEATSMAIIGRVCSGVRCDIEKGVVSPRFDVSWITILRHAIFDHVSVANPCRLFARSMQWLVYVFLFL